MPARSETNEGEKFDHSGHPTTHPLPDDLNAPGGGSTERPNRSGDSRGGVAQREPVTPPDRATGALSARRNTRIRRLESRSGLNR